MKEIADRWTSRRERNRRIPPKARVSRASSRAQCLRVHAERELPSAMACEQRINAPRTIRQQMRDRERERKREKERGWHRARACGLMVPKHAYEISRFREFFHFRAAAATPPLLPFLHPPRPRLASTTITPPAVPNGRADREISYGEI